MIKLRITRIVPFLVCGFLFAIGCTNKEKKSKEEIKINVAKGLYSFGPEAKTFTRCENGKSYWVADSAKTLELAYQELGFEKPYLPVYIEVECHVIKSPSLITSGNYDSTLVVTKLLKITKQIPDGPCAQ